MRMMNSKNNKNRPKIIVSGVRGCKGIESLNASTDRSNTCVHAKFQPLNSIGREDVCETKLKKKKNRPKNQFFRAVRGMQKG